MGISKYAEAVIDEYWQAAFMLAWKRTETGRWPGERAAETQLYVARKQALYDLIERLEKKCDE